MLFEGDDIVGSRMARQSIALFAAPAMSIERLAKVKTIVVTFVGGPPPDTFEVVTPTLMMGTQRAYSVVGAHKVPNTEMHTEIRETADPCMCIHLCIYIFTRACS